MPCTSKMGANITVTHSNISKLGHTTSIKGSRLNGQNALVLSHNSTALLEGCVLNSQADGAAAVFAAGPEASVKLHNTNVRTSGLWSPGLAVQKKARQKPIMSISVRPVLIQRHFPRGRQIDRDRDPEYPFDDGG